MPESDDDLLTSQPGFEKAPFFSPVRKSKKPVGEPTGFLKEVSRPDS